MKKDLLDLFKKVNEKGTKLELLFPDNQFLNDILEIIEDMIFDSYEISEDTTLNYSHEELQEFGETDKYPKEFFCRDYWTDLLYDFGQGKITKKDLIKKLKGVKES